MSGRAIVCAVIPEKADDERREKYLVVAPEDRIVWVAAPGDETDSVTISEERKQAVTRANIASLTMKLEREQQELSAEEADILDISDEQLDCRERNEGICERYPRLAGACDAEGSELCDDECRENVLECWLLEEEVD